MKPTYVFVLLFAVLPFLCIAQTGNLSGIISKGAELEKLAGGFMFTEGPSPDAEGNIYFTDQPNNRILRWSDTEGLSVFMEPAGRSNGLCFDREGNLWACADEKNEIWKITPSGELIKISNIYQGKLFNGPNDLWVSPSGGIYFTDPFYRRKWWSHTEMPQEKQCVYYLSPDHKNISLVASDLEQPNGIVGTEDGKTLFVADIRAKKTWKYIINPDGTLTDKTLFCELGSDGMAIDTKGNLYLTGNGVTVFDKTGKQTGNIPVPEKWTANVCFGGRNMKNLYITASTGFYRLKMKVKGTRG